MISSVAPASSALRPRLTSTRNSCSRSAWTKRSSGTSLTQRQSSLLTANSASRSSSTRSSRRKAASCSTGAPSRVKFRLLVQSLTARSMVVTRRGVMRRTSGSSMVARRSESREAVERMLRRSWLILLTAVPSAARRVFWRRAARTASCMSCNCRSAQPISSPRDEGSMTLRGSSGFSLKAVMLLAMRRKGRTSTRCSARNSRLAVIAEIIRDSARMR